jgi:hypothetical protein
MPWKYDSPQNVDTAERADIGDVDIVDVQPVPIVRIGIKEQKQVEKTDDDGNTYTTHETVRGGDLGKVALNSSGIAQRMQKTLDDLRAEYGGSATFRSVFRGELFAQAQEDGHVPSGTVQDE